MPKRIALQDGTYVNFPDTMSDKEIEAVLQKQYPKPKVPGEKPKPTTTDVLATNVPNPLDILGGIAEQPAAAIADVGGLAVQSVQALVKSGISKAAKYDPGGGWMEVYMQELEDKLTKDESQSYLNTFKTLTAPQTETGKLLYDLFAEVFEYGIQAFGDQVLRKGLMLPLPVLGDRLTPNAYCRPKRCSRCQHGYRSSSSPLPPSCEVLSSQTSSTSLG